MKKNIVVVHGGDTYQSYEEYVENLRNREVHLERMKPRTDWKATLEVELGEAFEVFLPRMPMSDNADYELWKLWFERVLDAVPETPILIGHSLGAMFLTKYYSEVILTSPLPALFLVAPEFLSPETEMDKQTSFTLRENIEKVTENAEQVVFFHSRDDFLVSFENQALFKAVIPDAEYVTMEGRGHCLEESFPEIVEAIKRLA